MIQLSISDIPVRTLTAILLKKFDDTEEPMRFAGQALVDSVRRRIDSEGYGGWEPRKEPTGSFPLLKRTQLLYNTIRYTLSGPQDDVTVTSDAEYDEYVDRGTRNMPARPFYELDVEDEKEIEGIFDDYIAARF